MVVEILVCYILNGDCKQTLCLVAGSNSDCMEEASEVQTFLDFLELG